MTHADDLRKFWTETLRLCEQMADMAEEFAAMREAASAKGFDWSQLKSLAMARTKDDRDGSDKRVRKLVEKADFACSYAATLKLCEDERKTETRSEKSPPQPPSVPTAGAGSTLDAKYGCAGRPGFRAVGIGNGSRMSESFLNGKIELHCGDCLAVLPTLAENSVDSVVCDPPYHLTSIVKRFGATSRDDQTKTSERARAGADGFARVSRGFMGNTWDGGDVAFQAETWAQVLRVLKPGGHLLAFSGTRTYHRMACAIEDAGFEIRDQIQWLYGSGFPKSHDISKAVDAMAGAKRPVVGSRRADDIRGGNLINTETKSHVIDITATAAAAEWEGWGTALKPACEPILLARKPLSERTVAANVLKWGTGSINIDGCRIETSEQWEGRDLPNAEDGVCLGGTLNASSSSHPLGRWPANVIHDGSEEVVAGFPDAPGQQFYVGPEHGDRPSRGIYGDFGPRPENEPRGDKGSVARFFYGSKADSNDRLGSKHPTVKPLDLMQYLVRLVTPRGGVVLDPFAGTGTTGAAAWREGFSAVLIERESEYQNDIRRRMALALAGPDERAHAPPSKSAQRTSP